MKNVIEFQRGATSYRATIERQANQDQQSATITVEDYCFVWKNDATFHSQDQKKFLERYDKVAIPHKDQGNAKVIWNQLWESVA